MFDIGWSELLVIAVVAIVVIGPKDLPGALRAFGRWTGKVRRMAGDFQRQFSEALKEAELDDLHKLGKEVKNAVTERVNLMREETGKAVGEVRGTLEAATADPELSRLAADKGVDEPAPPVTTPEPAPAAAEPKP
ncbi:MAG TPA: Sec-independent protein translocase protein TatB [Bauldia sp.]|nr:Sec-independent protein translocase protein TatB [Bauldia sp.]